MATREVEKTIQENIKGVSVAVLFGMSGSGVENLLDRCFDDAYTHVPLKDEDDRFLANTSPRQFLDLYTEPLIIEDADNAPPLLIEIVNRVQNGKKKGANHLKPRFVLSMTDHSILADLSFRLGKELRVFKVPPLSFLEEKGVVANNVFSNNDVELFSRIEKEEALYENRAALFKRLLRGSFPGMVGGTLTREAFYAAFLKNISSLVSSGLRQRMNEGKFLVFLRALALRSSSHLELQELSSLVGVDHRTIKRWIEILSNNLLIAVVDPLSPDVSKRIIKTPKIYFLDTGLCAYLARYIDSGALSYGPLSGAIVETYVFSELYKHLLNKGLEPRNYLFYYADIDKKKVDFILSDGENIRPILVEGLFPKEEYANDLKGLIKYGKVVLPAVRYGFSKNILKHKDFIELPLYSIGL